MRTMKLSIDELATLAGVSVRSVRYLLSAGDLDPPEMNGRRGEFSPEHLRRLIEIARGDAGGRKSINTFSDGGGHREGEITSLLRCAASDGVEVLVDLHRARLSRQQAQTLFSAIAELVQQSRTSEHNESAMKSPLTDATPQGTIAMMEELKLLGLSEEAFRVIHDKPGETMEKHLDYVRSLTGSFKAHSRNAIVNHRLQMCLHEARHRANSVQPLGAKEWHEIALGAASAIPVPRPPR